jgi:hypothetical protein
VKNKVFTLHYTTGISLALSGLDAVDSAQRETSLPAASSHSECSLKSIKYPTTHGKIHRFIRFKDALFHDTVPGPQTGTLRRGICTEGADERSIP